jgi:hypothetical protein
LSDRGSAQVNPVFAPVKRGIFGPNFKGLFLRFSKKGTSELFRGQARRAGPATPSENQMPPVVFESMRSHAT